MNKSLSGFSHARRPGAGPLSAAISMLFGTALLTGPVQAADKFEKTSVVMEQTVEDADAEVKFEAIGGGSAGLLALTVTAPDGRVVVDFKASASKLGIRHLTLESPEPKNDGKLQADFPEGVYKFLGSTTAGETLRGEATLSHKLPSVVSIVRPRADAANIPITALRVTWAAVKDAEAIAVVIEDEKTGREVRATLPGKATGFAVPEGFLAEGVAYKLAVGSIAMNGNKSVSEIGFTTTARKLASARTGKE